MAAPFPSVADILDKRTSVVAVEPPPADCLLEVAQEFLEGEVTPGQLQALLDWINSNNDPLPASDDVSLEWFTQQAATNTNIKAATVADRLSQLAYTIRRRELFANKGRDFVNFVYQAAVNPETGLLLFDHEDYVHKLKNMIAQVSVI